ncbi:MAG TPA: MFS transporter [Solirubrobacteraceae bacterium]|nr:MFS transporter [Solirubrobacteraceae bacterium]
MTRTAHRLTNLLPGDRRFALLLSSLAVSSCGDWLYNVALLAIVFERTHSATWLAATTAARISPVVVFGPLGGALADRYDRRRLIITSDLLRASLMVALAGVVVAGLPIVLAPVIAAAATAAGVVHPPCVAACTARLVADDELQRASVLRSATGQAAIVVGPGLGALVLLLTSPTVAIALNALTFLASAAAVTAIAPGEALRPPAGEADALRIHLLADMRAGAQALRGAPATIRLVAVDVICSVVAGILTVTFVLVARRVGAGNSGYGLLFGAFGAGGLIGAAVTARIEATAHWRRAIAVALLVVGGAVAGLGVAPGLFAALLLALLVGGGSIVGEVLVETALPRLLDPDVLGRAYGLAFPAALLGIVAGSLIAGPLVGLLGIGGAFGAVGVYVLLAGGLLVNRPLEVTSLARIAESPALERGH